MANLGVRCEQRFGSSEVQIGAKHVTKDGQISHDAAKLLTKLSKLKRFSANDTPLGDAGMALLEQAPDLEYICIYQTTVTDAGLAHLKGLKKLRTLEINNEHRKPTTITDAAHEPPVWNERLEPVSLPSPLNLRYIVKQHFPDSPAPL